MRSSASYLGFEPARLRHNDVTPEGLAQIDAELALARTAYAAAQKSNDRAGLASALRDMRYWASRRATAQIVLPAGIMSKFASAQQ